MPEAREFLLVREDLRKEFDFVGGRAQAKGG
jgi:hypothetical protein